MCFEVYESTSKQRTKEIDSSMCIIILSSYSFLYVFIMLDILWKNSNHFCSLEKQSKV